MDAAYYEPAGQNAYVATSATAGPWSPDAQHGGPPSALAARAIELHEPDERQRLARVSIDILRPVPVGKVSVIARTLRPGRRVTLVEAVMEADGVEVLHARGWRLERPSASVPEFPDGDPPEPVPERDEGWPTHLFRGFRVERSGYLASVEWRFGPARARATTPVQEATPATTPARSAWARPRLPLVPGEEQSAMARTLLVADSGSGVGAVLPATSFLFINVDLTVTLTRDPVGDWILLEPTTMIGAAGTGLTSTRLSDVGGAFGRGAQSLLVGPR